MNCTINMEYKIINPSSFLKFLTFINKVKSKFDEIIFRLEKNTISSSILNIQDNMIINSIFSNFEIKKNCKNIIFVEFNFDLFFEILKKDKKLSFTISFVDNQILLNNSFILDYQSSQVNKFYFSHTINKNCFEISSSCLDEIIQGKGKIYFCSKKNLVEIKTQKNKIFVEKNFCDENFCFETNISLDIFKKYCIDKFEISFNFDHFSLFGKTENFDFFVFLNR